MLLFFIFDVAEEHRPLQFPAINRGCDPKGISIFTSFVIVPLKRWE